MSGAGTAPTGPGAAAVWPATAVLEDGRLVAVGGIDVDDLAAAHDTPLYVVDAADLVGRMRAYRAAFGPGTAVAYGSKALCVTGVLQLAAHQGLWVDVASAGELRTAELAGVPMDRVILHGNNKSAAELARAVELGVGRVVVDSFDELDRLVALPGSDPIRVLLRVTPGILAETHAFVATGQDDAKFGFSIARGLATAALERVRAEPRLQLTGLHAHIGSQLHVADGFTAAVAALAAFCAAHDLVPDELNLGGGLGIPYTAEERILPLDDYAATIRAAVAEHFPHGPRLMVEPGRSIAGPAGITLYRVGTVKHVPGVKRFAAVDGGMSDNLRPALYGARYTVAPAGRRAGRGPAVPWTVAGKHCETGDVLAVDVPLPDDLAVDQLLAVAATGAYGFAMANNYNRLPRPAMVLVGDGRADLLVRRETVDDVVRLDVPLPAERLA